MAAGAVSQRKVAVKRKRENSIKSLPGELITEVLALVASNSVADLVNAELSCKEILQVADDYYVFEHASMEKFPVAPWPVADRGKRLFLKKCKESGNPEALFRQGVFEYFSQGNENYGRQLLEKAVQKGHAEATYVYSIILICSDNQFSVRGFKILSSLNDSSRKFSVMECREKVESAILSLWIRNIIHPPVAGHACDCERKNRRKRGWEEEDDDGIYCESCLPDREAAWFCDLLKNRVISRPS